MAMVRLAPLSLAIPFGSWNDRPPGGFLHDLAVHHEHRRVLGPVVAAVADVAAQYVHRLLPPRDPMLSAQESPQQPYHCRVRAVRMG